MKKAGIVTLSLLTAALAFGYELCYSKPANRWVLASPSATGAGERSEVVFGDAPLADVDFSERN